MIKNERILYWDQVESTLNYIQNYVYALDHNDRLWIEAAEQTKGVGQWGRSFSSPRGGLYFTLMLRWPYSIPLCFVSLLSALAIADVLPVACHIKWLNDLYVQGKKLGGVLVHSIPGSDNKKILCISFGLNINTKKNLLSPFQGTSLVDVLGYSLDIHNLFSKIRSSFDHHIDQMLSKTMESRLEELYPLLIGWQKPVHVITVDMKTVTGVWTGIDGKTGQVMIDQCQRCWARSIVPLFDACLIRFSYNARVS